MFIFGFYIDFDFSAQVPPGPTPANILNEQVEFLPPPSPDSVPDGYKFGDVISDVSGSMKPGSRASVTFYGANPRHNMKVIANWRLAINHRNAALDKP